VTDEFRISGAGWALAAAEFWKEDLEESSEWARVGGGVST